MQALRTLTEVDPVRCVGDDKSREVACSGEEGPGGIQLRAVGEGRDRAVGGAWKWDQT